MGYCDIASYELVFDMKIISPSPPFPQVPSLELYGSVLLIVAGTVVSTAAEKGLPSWDTWGVTLFLTSSVFESVRTAMAQAMMQPLGFTAFESLVFTTPAISILTILTSAALEGRELVAHGFGLVRQNPWLYTQIALTGTLVNFSSFWCLRRVSGLTMKIVVCVRNVLVVWAGILRGDKVTSEQALGYLVSMAGFLAYSYVRASQARRGRDRGRGAGGGKKKKAA